MTLKQQNTIGACISAAAIALIGAFMWLNWDNRMPGRQECPTGTVEHANGPRFEIGAPTCVLP